MPSAEYYAARRAKKLADHQAALPPEERIVNRTDWDDDVQKRVTVLTRRDQATARKAFIETVTDPAVGVCATPEQAEAYFRRGGTPFTTHVLRVFIEGSAASRGGYIKDAISARSLSNMLLYLFGAARQAGNPVERDVRDATMLWVDGPLLLRGLTHNTAREKVTALPQDVTQFLQALFSREFMCSRQTTREVLLIVLFVCIMIDCSSRVSELLRPGMSKATAVEYDKERSDKMFRWGSVEVFAFKDQEEGPVFLQARLTFRRLKGPVGKKGYRIKTIPLRLLPPENVAEDTLFWLMTLGLIDSVFHGISSWSDIDRLQPGRSGQLIPIVASMRETPVFRNRTTWLRVDKPLISNDQMGAQAMLKFLHKLSRFIGLEHAMLANVLRRGSAYLLAISVSPEERCARMGHLPKDLSYWSSYRNTTSTVDFQALRHNIEAAPVAQMSSAFLNTDTAKPPTCLSEEGVLKVHQDPEIVDLLDQKSTMLDGLLRDHGSLDKAKTLDPGRHEQYRKFCLMFNSKMNHLRQIQFKLEYEAYWEQRKQGLDSAGQQNDDKDKGPSPEEHPVATLGRSEVDLLLDEQERREEEAAGSDIPIDPRLLEEEEAESAEALLSLAASLDEGEANGFSDAVQEPGASASNSASTSAAAAAATTTTSSGPMKGPLSGPRQAARYSLVDDVPAWLYDQPPGITWAELSARFVVAFNHIHEADRFYPGQEPLPGTYDCRFCGQTLIGVRCPYFHAHSCEAEGLARGILERLEPGDTGAASTCPLTFQRQNGTTRPCQSKMVRGPNEFFEHARRNHGLPGPPPVRWRCLDHGAAPLFFNSLPDFRMHVVVAHNAPTSILNSEALMFFCPFCQVWIPRTEQLEEAHLTAHASDIATTIAAKGLPGHFCAMVWTDPAFCPFCVYNPALDIMTRLRQHARQELFLTHVSSHLKEIEGTAVCPATAPTKEGLPRCPNAASLGPAEMAAHLREAHGLDVKAPAAKAPVLDGVQEGEKKTKKRKTTTGRTPLAEVDANQQQQ